MIVKKNFFYSPDEHEAEKASNSYLMSLIALMAGLPMPVINLLATLFFYVGNRKGTWFVRWHCTQALFSQFFLLIINSVAFWWTISLFFGDAQVSNLYLGYISTVLIFNLAEFIATIYTAVETRKGLHVEWWFFGAFTNLISKDNR